jgi:flagellar motor switch protein FliN/FliY
MSDEKEDDPWADALAEQKAAGDDTADADDIDDILAGASGDDDAAAEETPKNKEKSNVAPASFEEFDEGDQHQLQSLGDSESNLDLILDVPVTVSMEVGRTQVPIRTLLQLSQGSVVELDRLAGEPLDVLVNGTLIAHGEVVVVNEKFGIRLTDVISPAERVRKLK